MMDNKDPLQYIEHQLAELETKMHQEEVKRNSLFKDIHSKQVGAARNLIHYLALRSEDIRDLQDQLHICGLSSLASAESHILRQVQAILERLGKKYDPDEPDSCTYTYNHTQLLEKNKKLFGRKKDSLIPYIMVTFDSSLAENYSFIKTLLQNGMNVARINCAHDSESIWARMIHQLKRAMYDTGMTCKVYMDLAGPKIRTKLINKGNKKGKAKLEEGGLFWLAYQADEFEADDIVVSPDEPGIITMLNKGERVYIDDGMIKGEIENINGEKAAVRVVRISSTKHHIKNDKGINFPDSDITIESLTGFDRACLPFICEHADMVGYSFVRYPSDISRLQQSLQKISTTPPKIILKIETPEAVKNLPGLLLQGMKDEVFGVMIARGDLAVEIGFERMGEIQEEILWICEAAHAPVVWATQVLESLNKTGVATRSEITDAAHAAMAECIMINKGDHTIKVIETLRNILQRIGGHHIKKRFLFRPLSIAKQFLESEVYIKG
ncbi:MAG TPA: pyruvate kinase [Chitinophagaceae bacterium]|nr:pyruvate kinase [Chitinophagaceae bacterium]